MVVPIHPSADQFDTSSEIQQGLQIRAEWLWASLPAEAADCVADFVGAAK